MSRKRTTVVVVSTFDHAARTLRSDHTLTSGIQMYDRRLRTSSTISRERADMTTNGRFNFAQWRGSLVVCLFALMTVVMTACGGGGSGGGGGSTQPTAQSTTITAQPVSVTAVAGAGAVFSVTATGDDLTYQWQTSQDRGTTWTSIPDANATGATFTVQIPIPELDGYQFRVVVTGTGGSVTSSAATLTVPSSLITTQPAAQTVAVGASATFSVVATGTSPTYVWQRSVDGTAWTAIDGATSASFTTPATALTDSGTRFRVVVTASEGSATSDTALLTVVAGTGSTGGTGIVGTDCTLNYFALPIGTRLDTATDTSNTGFPTVNTVTTTTVVGAATFQGLAATEVDSSSAGINGTFKLYGQTGSTDSSFTLYGFAIHQALSDGSTVSDDTGVISNPTASALADFLLGVPVTVSTTTTQTLVTTVSGVAGTPSTSTSTDSLTTTYLGTESVTTPAGTFNTCKFQDQVPGESGISTTWYMVGYSVIVKSADTSPDSSSQLTSFKVNGVTVTHYP